MNEFADQLMRRADGAALTAGSFIMLASALVPLVVAAALWAWFPPDKEKQGTIVLAALWNAVWLLALNMLAVQVGWWDFAQAGPAIGSVPIVLWFGWTVLWGVAAPLSPLSTRATIAVLAVIDLIYMPLLQPIVQLGPRWLIGEAVALAAVAWPTLVVARWTLSKERLRERLLLQFALCVAILLWIIPLLAVTATGQTLEVDVPTWAFGAVVFGFAGAALPGLIAVHDFYLNAGTPWPWDSTDRPVRSGPYRFVRSPMQMSGMLVVVAATFLYGQPIILTGVASTLFYSRLFSSLEERDLQQRFGQPWAEIALPQRRWIPQWTPSPHGEPATVWVNYGCDMCVPIADFLLERNPINLTFRSASDHPEPLTRLRYERADGATFDGVTAVGACLEHLNLGWAVAGWALRMPVLWRVWQLIGDASGFEARPAVAGDPPEPLRELGSRRVSFKPGRGPGAGG